MSDKQLEAVSVQKAKSCGQKGAWTRELHHTRSVCHTEAEVNVRHDSERMGEARNVVKSVPETDPKNYRDAMSSELENKWQIAMNVELEALHHNEGWVVEVPLTGSTYLRLSVLSRPRHSVMCSLNVSRHV